MRATDDDVLHVWRRTAILRHKMFKKFRARWHERLSPGQGRAVKSTARPQNPRQNPRKTCTIYTEYIPTGLTDDA